MKLFFSTLSFLLFPLKNFLAASHGPLVKRLLIVLTMTLSFATAFSAQAWMMRQEATTLEYLAKNADYICRIQVQDTHTERASLSDDFNWVVTWVYPEVLHCWKGELGRQIEFISLGGYLDGFEYNSSGLFPIFHQGEESIVFLKIFPQGIAPLSHGFGRKIIERGFMKETGESLSQFITRLEGVLQS